MRWRLPEKSLFARLLRAPWWVSALIGAVLALGMSALMPDRFKAAGALGSLPFWLIAALAAWRQRELLSATELLAARQHLATLAWREGQALVEAALQRDGHTLSPPEGRPDEGVDLIARRHGRTTLVLGRRWKAARLGEDTLRPLLTAMARLDASAGLCLTQGEPTPQAVALARRHGVELLAGDALLQWLRPPIPQKPKA